MAAPLSTLPSLKASIEAAQAWWRSAGVDLAYHDEALAWLRSDEPAAATKTAAPADGDLRADPRQERIGGDQAHWPKDLDGFRDWWLEEPTLDGGGLHGRVSPRGSARAKLMIIVPMPEAEDHDALLSGAQGRLIDAMTRAMGLPGDELYLAAALPRHMAVPAWGDLHAGGLGDVLRHHIRLVAPERILVLGRDVLSLLGHDWAQSAPAVSEIEIQNRQLPLLNSYAPARLLEHPRLRADLWRQWLDWTNGTSE